MTSRMRWISLLLFISTLGVAGAAVEMTVASQYQAAVSRGPTAIGGPPQQTEAASASPLAVGQTLEGRLEAGDAQDAEGRYQDRFTFQGQVGQTATVEAHSFEFDTTLLVEDAAAQKVTGDDDGGIGTNARVVLKVPQAGPYIIVVSSSDSGETGGYQLKLQAGEMAPAQGGVKGELDEQYYQKAVEQARARGQVNRQARLLRGLGDAKVAQTKEQQALEPYEQAVKLAMGVKNRKEEARARGGLGRAYANLGQAGRAIGYYEQAVAIAREVKDREGEGIWLGSLGDAHWRLDQSERAIEYFEQAVAIARQINDRGSEARWLGSLGMTLRNLGQFERSIERYEQALAIARQINDRRGEGRWLGNLGNTGWDLGYYEQAVGYYQQALAVAREIKDRRAEGAWLGNLGITYQSLGQSERAIEYFEQAVVIAREIKNRGTEGYWLGNMGDAYLSLSQWERAIEYFEQALAITRETKDRQNETRWLVDVGRVYERLGRAERAIEYYERALANVREHKNRRNEARCLGYLGDAYRSLGQSERARAYYEQALAIAREDTNRDAETQWLVSLGQTYRHLGQFERARATLQEALGIPQAAGDPQNWAVIHHELARIAQQQNQPERAEAEYEAARALLEQLRHRVTTETLRTSFFAAKQKFYQDYLAFLMDRGHIQRALEVAETARARSLLETLTEARADIRQGVDPALLDRERNLQQLLNAKAERLTRLLNGRHTEEQATAAKKELSALLTQYQEVQAQIRTSSPRYAALTQPQPLSLKEIQQQVVDEDTLLLEYALGEERSFLWAVTPTSIKTYELPKRVEIEAAARRIYEWLSTSNMGATKEEAGAMAAWSQMLLGPVTEQLGQKRLLIVSEGALQYVPFAALPVPRVSGPLSVVSSKTTDNEQRTTGSRPLIVDHEIVNLPSASVLGVLRRELVGRQPARATVAVLLIRCSRWMTKE